MKLFVRRTLSLPVMAIFLSVITLEQIIQIIPSIWNWIFNGTWNYKTDFTFEDLRESWPK